jgi:WD40 repeat protein
LNFVLSLVSKDEKRISSHRQNTGGINAIALSRDQTVALTVGQEKKITYWDLREAQPIRQIHPAHRGEATCIAVRCCRNLFFPGNGVQKVWSISFY